MPSVKLLIESLPLNAPFALDVEGLKFVVVRTPKAVYAFEDTCPHAMWPLSAGTFHDGVLECPGHAWEFQVETGRCQDSPAYCLVPVATNILGEFVRLEWGANFPKREVTPSRATEEKNVGTHGGRELSQLHE